MEPLISIRLEGGRRQFRPGEQLRCDYQLDAVDPADLQAVEVSVLWHTEGKGDEDLGVHFFERLVPGDRVGENPCALRRLTTVLPNSPLTYAGVIVKIRWCVRVRAFLRRGKDVFFEQPFVLGQVPPARSVCAPDDTPRELSNAPVEPS